jgi:hypothetical protein
MVGYLMNDELQRVGKESLVVQWRGYSRIDLQRLKKSMKNLNQDMADVTAEIRLEHPRDTNL